MFSTHNLDECVADLFVLLLKIILCISIGGTGDITIHEVQSDQSVYEKSMAAGWAWGGDTIKGAFMQIWKDILGKVRDYKLSHNLLEYLYFHLFYLSL